MGTDILQTLIYVVANALGLALIYAVLFLTNRLKDKIKDERLHATLNLASSVVVTAVRETNQTFVEDLKKIEAFDAEKAQEAFVLAFNKAVDLLDIGSIKVIQQAGTNVEELLTSLIEAEVNRQN